VLTTPVAVQREASTGCLFSSVPSAANTGMPVAGQHSPTRAPTGAAIVSPPVEPQPIDSGISSEPGDPTGRSSPCAVSANHYGARQPPPPTPGAAKLGLGVHTGSFQQIVPQFFFFPPPGHPAARPRSRRTTERHSLRRTGAGWLRCDCSSCFRRSRASRSC